MKEDDRVAAIERPIVALELSIRDLTFGQYFIIHVPCENQRASIKGFLRYYFSNISTMSLYYRFLYGSYIKDFGYDNNIVLIQRGSKITDVQLLRKEYSSYEAGFTECFIGIKHFYEIPIPSALVFKIAPIQTRLVEKIEKHIESCLKYKS